MKKLIITILALAVGISIACKSDTADKVAADNLTVKSTATPEVETKTAENKFKTDAEEKLIELFDGRKETENTDFAKSETELVQAEFDRKKELIKEKFGDRYCEESEVGNIGINGIVKGSFTKPRSDQKAVFYDVCRSGSSHFGVGGIIVFENDKTVSHYVYGENGLQNSILSAPDVNKNGLNELILVDFQTHQGYSGGTIILVEFANESLKFLGNAVTYSSNSGAVENEKNVESTAYKISVQPSAKPTFFRETYQAKGNNENWKLAKKSEKFTLDKTDSDFVKGFKKITD